MSRSPCLSPSSLSLCCNHISPTSLLAGRVNVKVHGLFDRFFAGMSYLAEHHARGVIAFFALVVARLEVSQLHIETRMTERLAETTMCRSISVGFKSTLARSICCSCMSTGEAGGLLEPELNEGLARFSEDLERDPLVDSVDSLVDLHELVHEALKPEGDRSLRPNTREAYAQYTLLYEMGGGEGLDRLMDLIGRVR